MKKADVLQLSIILIGIVFGFFTLQYILSSLYTVFFWIFGGGYGGEGYFSTTITIFAVAGLQAICCWLLITKSERIAALIYQRSKLGSTFKIVSKPNDLLYILLTAIGIYLLLSTLSPLLQAIFQSFKDAGSGGIRSLFDEPRPTNWKQLILDIILPLILLMFGKPIADYFAKNLSDEEMIIEETEEKTDITESTEN